MCSLRFALTVTVSDAPSQRLRILLADDEANIRRILVTRLRLLGHELAVAENGRQALELFRVFEPDLVLLDV